MRVKSQRSKKGMARTGGREGEREGGREVSMLREGGREEGREGLTFIGEDVAEAKLGRAHEVQGQAQDTLCSEKHQQAEKREREGEREDMHGKGKKSASTRKKKVVVPLSSSYPSFLPSLPPSLPRRPTWSRRHNAAKNEEGGPPSSPPPSLPSWQRPSRR